MRAELACPAQQFYPKARGFRMPMGIALPILGLSIGQADA